MSSRYESSAFWELGVGLSGQWATTPDIVNLYSAYYMKRFNPKFDRRCVTFKRYIDDIFDLLPWLPPLPPLLRPPPLQVVAPFVCSITPD